MEIIATLIGGVCFIIGCMHVREGLTVKCIAKFKDSHMLPENKQIVVCPYCMKVVGEY
jgi:hypothetical protein